jgi:ribonuclease HI
LTDTGPLIIRVSGRKEVYPPLPSEKKPGDRKQEKGNGRMGMLYRLLYEDEIVRVKGEMMNDQDRQSVVIYTDGYCKPNPGRGGYAAVIIYSSGAEIELTGACKQTTNNRMEMMGLMVGLEFLDGPMNVTAFSDSRYVVNAVKKWKRRGRKKMKKNADLWKRMGGLLAVHSVTAIWVKGHAGNPGNERCDRLARLAGMGRAVGSLKSP